MDDCIFCKIVKKEIPSSIVYEDDNILSFMTIEAVNEGHLLVIPKQHVPYVHEIEEGLYKELMLAVRKLSKAVNEALRPEKVGIMVSGWEVPHAHVHVVPLTVPSDIASKKLLDGNGIHPAPQELKDTAQKIQNAFH